jgi:hypothetical protein
MVRVRDDRSVTINGNSAALRVTCRRVPQPQQVAPVTASALPQNVEELTATIVTLIRHYREARGSGAGTDAAIALAAADRENFRALRRRSARSL